MSVFCSKMTLTKHELPFHSFNMHMHTQKKIHLDYIHKCINKFANMLMNLAENSTSQAFMKQIITQVTKHSSSYPE